MIGERFKRLATIVRHLTQMTKRLVFPLAILGTAVASIIIAVVLSHSRTTAQTRNGSWIPYQIAYRAYSNHPGEPPMLVADQIKAVRSDGATAESSTLYHADGTKDRLERVLALPGGIRIRTDDSLAIMTATRNPAEDGVFSPSHQRDPSRSCNGTMDGAGQSAGSTAVAGKPFLGFSTYLIASDLGRYRHYIWRAAALGCADLHFRGDKMDATTGQVISHSEIVALSVQPAEPDPKLFALPTGLKNMGPMEMTSMQASVCCNKRLSDAELSPLQQAEEHFKQFRFDF